MNILLTIVLLRSGMLTHVWDLVNHLPSSGMKVSVAVNNCSGDLNDSVQKENKFLLEKFKNVPVCFYESFQELLEFAGKQKAELIHSHSPLTFFSSLDVSQRLSLPLVLTLHGTIMWPKFFQGVLGHALRIIAIGPEAARSVGDQYSPKIRIIYNGIDVKKFRPHTEGTGQVRPLRVLWFGRMNPPSALGLRALDLAVEKLRARGRQIEAHMVGQAEGVTVHNIEVHGWADNPIPYLNWSHAAFGRGRALREAMACGSVGFLLAEGYGGPVREDWFSGRNYTQLSGSLKHGFSETDPEVIAHHLAVLDDNEQMLQTLRREARLTAENYFDVRRMVEKTVQVYRESVTWKQIEAGREES